MLERLLKRIDRIGGGRNRSPGLVKLKTKGKPRQRETRSADGVCLRLLLRNLEPLCLPATGSPLNLIQSHSFIRGQAVRGALVHWALQNGKQADLGVFAKLSVGDALPLPEAATPAGRVIPMPLSILTSKPAGCAADAAAGRPWWAAPSPAPDIHDSLAGKKDHEEKPKRPGAHEFLYYDEARQEWLRYQPRMRVRLRNATPRRGQTTDALLFSLEEIAEDTLFQTELRFDTAADAATFQKVFQTVLDGEDWLLAGRGGIPLEVASLATGPVPSAIVPDPIPDDWTFTLTSDLIVRGKDLGFLDDLDCQAICKLAGIAYERKWTVVEHVAETECLHGFNAVSGLQRAPALAIRRGSCWRIRVQGSAALARALAALPALGERTVEGYGRFLIGIQPIQRLARPAGSSRAPEANRHESLRTQARELEPKIPKPGPSLSQLQWLRSRALAARNEPDLQDLLKEIRTAPTRRPQGGKSWEDFPVDPLAKALEKLDALEHKKHLISYLVQRRVPSAKAQRATRGNE